MKKAFAPLAKKPAKNPPRRADRRRTLALLPRPPRRVLPRGGTGRGCACTTASRSARRRRKKLIERSGMTGEIRAHECCEKPCEARTRKEAGRRSTTRKAAQGELVRRSGRSDRRRAKVFDRLNE